MTREEAIEVIQNFMGWFKHDSRIYKALEMAIKALSQEPCETIHGSTYGGVSWGGAYKPQEPCDDAISRSVEWQNGYLQGVENTAKEFKVEIERFKCDDAISREAVIDGINKYIQKAQSTGTQDDLISFEELVIKQLPSVTQKSGKWNEYYTSQKGNDVFNCKECGHTFVVTQGKDNMNYCPNCGAKMESEDKE